MKIRTKKELSKNTKEELIKELKSTERKLNDLQKKEKIKQGAKTFDYVLSLISIAGFLGIIFNTFFYLELTAYVKFSWMMIMGIGLIIQADTIDLIKKVRKSGLEGENFHKLITSTIGVLATLIGILTFPMWNITSPGFLAIKGTIAIIAVLYIVIQTWVIK